MGWCCICSGVGGGFSFEAPSLYIHSMDKIIRAIKRWNKDDVMDLHTNLVKLSMLCDGRIEEVISIDDIPTCELPSWASLRGVWAMDKHSRVLLQTGKDKWRVVDRSELPAPKELMLTEHKTLGGKSEVPVSFRVTSRMKTLMEEAAQDRSISVSSWVREVLAEKLIDEGYVDDG